MGADSTLALQDDWKALLRAATQSKDWEVAEQIVSQYGAPADGEAMPLIHLAAIMGGSSLIKRLIGKGVSPDSRVPDWGLAPLHAVSLFGRPEATDAEMVAVIRTLISAGADANATVSGLTALDMCHGSGNAAAAIQLAEAGAKPVRRETAEWLRRLQRYQGPNADGKSPPRQ